MPAPRELLRAWLEARLPRSTVAWLDDGVRRASEHGADAAFLLAFSTAGRQVGRAALALSAAELAAARAARSGFDPEPWTADQAARSLLVLALPAEDPERHQKLLDGLFADADLGELVALYQALPLLPNPERHRARAAEGIRSNMLPVFQAIALRNPYPAEQLDEAAWNQLVLKCLFVGSPLNRVQGVDRRVNAALCRMLCDFAHERWAAGRPVPPDLWRCVGPLAEGDQIGDLERAVRTGSEAERAAVALAARGNPRASALLSAEGGLLAAALRRYPSWDALAST